MRTAVLISILFCFSCSTREPSPSSSDHPAPKPANDTEQAGAEHGDSSRSVSPSLPLTPPSIKLVSAGEAPRQRLGWIVKEGRIQSVKISMMTATTTGGRPMPFPPVGYLLTVVAKEVTGKTIRAEFTVDDILYPDVSADVPAEGVEGLKKALEPAKGKTGTYFVDARGVLTGIRIQSDSQEDPRIERLLQKLLDRATVPVPDEVVGPGATWTVTRVVDVDGARYEEVLTARLVKREGSRIDVAFNTVGTAPRQVLTTGAGAAPGRSLTMLGGKLEAKGTATYDLVGLVPPSLRITSVTEATYERPGDSPFVAEGATVITMTAE